ncbi:MULTISPECIES: hypothetical protein [Streptomyces]|uniref:SHOCT domain-containing protein n=1 Tax=Streptomyces lycii TaxID=2654337 RepID=A0ABQ7FR36_9ACTN|nr:MULTISPECIES: hypothetical protein [Streptomyces]KAF4411153.1 SHOCT domain-containing protein [Streptomyces lycii]PGH51447.1 hypothetical protein CRI70_06635 [Streptomyces sp. Ru87]
MNILAEAWRDGGGPGPWILLMPVLWALVVAGVIVLLRKTVWRGRGRGPWRGPGGRPGGPGGYAEHSPVTVLGRRFAAGEIDEDEYWRRLSVLNEEFGRAGREGTA